MKGPLGMSPLSFSSLLPKIFLAGERSLHGHKLREFHHFTGN